MPDTVAPLNDAAFLAGGGEVGAHMRRHDWSTSSLGDPSTWPQSLRSVVGLLLSSKFPMFVAWGPELGFLYNDAYTEILGAKHPAALGARFHDVWSEIWPDISPLIDEALAGQASYHEDLSLVMNRKGFDEQTWFTFSYSPVCDESGRVAGLFCSAVETTDRVLAERRNASERERLARMFEQAPGFITVLSGPEHVFDFANATYRRLFGSRDLVGKSARDAFPDLEGQGFFELLDQVYSTGERFVARHIPIRLERSPGEGQEEHFLDFIYEPILDDAGRVTGIFCEGHDVTETRRAEQALRESEERFRLLADSSPALIWMSDETARITFANKRYEEVFGRPADDMEGEGWRRVVHPGDLDEFHATFLNAFLARERVVMEVRVFDRSGDLRWLRCEGVPRFTSDGQFAGYVGVNLDVTEAKRAEEEFRASAEFNDRILAASSDCIKVLDLEARLQFMSAGGHTVMEVDDFEAIRGCPWPEFWSGEHRKAVEAAIAMAKAGGEGRFRGHAPTAKGTPRWWDVVVTAINGPDGKPERLLSVSRDVTSEHTAQEAIRRSEAELRHLNATLEQRVAETLAERQQAEEALRQAQKMEAVGQLTGGIAHDFNNLLAGIVGSLDLMQSRIAQGRTADLDRYVSAAMTSAQRAAALTHRLLAFSRRQPLDPKPVEANRLVAGMEDLLRRTLGPAISLEMVMAGGLWRTLCDPVQLESALLNLSINARDAMPDGGRLVIETANAHLDDAYAAAQRDVTPGQYVAICVTDTGVGMSPELVVRVFEPFFTTKPLGQGTGLGLSMVYGFAKQSEGHVRIYSEEGKGTTVKLYLPRHRGEADASVAEAVMVELPRAESGETVLVVEDEPVVRGLIVEVLGELGYQALEAVDGPSGLRLLQSRGRIDLLITDVGLPGLNGRQLADQARERRPDLKVLFITGYAENAMLANGFLEPGMAMLTKPFAVDALVRKIRDLMKGNRS